MKFNEKDANVKVRINQNCFISVNGKSYSGKTVVEKNDDKVVYKWVGDEVWVPESYANKLISDEKRPIARVIATRDPNQPKEATSIKKEAVPKKEAKAPREVVKK